MCTTCSWRDESKFCVLSCVISMCLEQILFVPTVVVIWVVVNINCVCHTVGNIVCINILRNAIFFEIVLAIIYVIRFLLFNTVCNVVFVILLVICDSVWKKTMCCWSNMSMNVCGNFCIIYLIRDVICNPLSRTISKFTDYMNCALCFGINCLHLRWCLVIFIAFIGLLWCVKETIVAVGRMYAAL